MCGIAGFTQAKLPGPQLVSVLDRMCATLVHRGPDQYGRLAVPEIASGLACRRLAIVGLDSGRQPISNEDGSVHVVANGEIYNHRELRRRLEQRGHRFSTDSDVEVVAHLYEEEGLECLPKLSGMFALAVLDVSAGRLILARDRCGMKPLYYGISGNGFFFASEIKALLAAGFPAQPDFTAIDTFLSLGYVPSPRTLFSGVKMLPAGHCVEVDARGVSDRPYWQFTFEDRSGPGKTEAEDAEELESLLDASVSSHLDTDVPVGLLVSGGWDSSLVAATASRIRGGPVKTFSLVFPEDPEFDESHYQQAISREIGSEHHQLEFRFGDIPELLPKAVFYQDAPSLAFPSEVQLRIAELASSSVKTVLSGEGADELFAGYSWFADSPYSGLRRLIPPALLRRPAEYLTHVRWGRVLRFLAAQDALAAEAEVGRIFTRREKRDILEAESPAEDGDLAPLRLHPETEASCTDALQRKLAVSFTRTLSDGLLTTNDRVSMAHSLEIRMPFLDNAMVEFARRLPSSMKRRNGQEKYILSLLKHRLPPAIANRKKHFLQAPVRRYYRGPLREWARSVLLDSSGPLNRPIIEKRFDGWLDGSDVYVRRVRALVAFQLWWNTFFVDSIASGKIDAS